MDLIDFQSNADGSFKFILSYQDHAIEFAHFRALTDKSAASVVAQELLAIFHIQGAPLLLQSDNGREFVNKVIQNLEAMWPGLKIIHGRPRHSQSQGGVERLNRTFNEMLNKWLADNPGKTWKEGVGFLQWQHNTRLQEGFSTVPYKAAYGIALFFLVCETLERGIKGVTGSLDLTRDLNEALESGSWKKMKKMSVGTAARHESRTGGQGFIRCDCKKGCALSKKCKCKTKGVLCNSSCHRAAGTCDNK